jgi:hypothetical protein
MRKRYNVGRGKYQTFASVEGVLQPGDVVVGMPGVYEEPLRVMDGVYYDLRRDVVFEYNGEIISDPTGSSDAVIEGGVFRHSESWVAVHLSGQTSLTLNGVVLNSTGLCVNTRSGVRFAAHLCSISADVDYGLLLGGTSWVMGSRITSNRNSAVHIGGGTADISGCNLLSHGWFGLEYSGGFNVLVRDTDIETTHSIELMSDCINKYGGLTLSLNDVRMKAADPAARCIGEQGREDAVTLLADCYANRTKSDLITLDGPGSLVVSADP